GGSGGPLAPVTNVVSTVTSAVGAPALTGGTGAVTNSGSASNPLAPVTSLIGGLLGGTHGK
ncbi:TPA: collagen-like triple helix repeat-containing lipoprotein, partial [Burkholderia cepacia]